LLCSSDYWATEAPAARPIARGSLVGVFYPIRVRGHSGDAALNVLARKVFREKLPRRVMRLIGIVCREKDLQGLISDDAEDKVRVHECLLQ
jgi:hypothetical protein